MRSTSPSAMRTRHVSLLLPTDVHIVFYLTAPQIAKLQRGSQVRVLCAGCSQSELATITYISPSAEFTPPIIYSRENQHKLSFKVQAQPQHPKRFHPGQPVTVILQGPISA